MSQRLTINMNSKPIYDIVYEQDFNSLAKELEQFEIQQKNCVLSRILGLRAFMQIRFAKCCEITVRRFLSTIFPVESRAKISKQSGIFMRF